MRRTRVFGLVCLTTCLFVASTAMAQGQGGRGRGGFGRGGFGRGGFGLGASQLLGNEKVQEELKLTSEQKEKLAALREEGGGRRGGRGAGGGGGFANQSPEEREKAMAEFRKRMEENNKKAEAILDPAQLKRLKELSLQARGNAALNDPEIAKALQLSEEQIASAKTIGEESAKRMGELFQSARDGNRDEMLQKMQELRNDTDEEYLALLTDDQKAKLAELKGPKADIDFAAGFGGPGRGGRRRGGNNN